MNETIDIDIMRHADGKQVYVSIRTDKGKIVLRGDRIAVYIERDLPEVIVWQDGKTK